MPDVEHSTTVSSPIDDVWQYVKDINNWAPFLTGYQRHEEIDEDNSIWFVKGELGGMTRVAEFKVNVTEWAAPNRVTFTMEGLQDPVNGSGVFLAESLNASSIETLTQPVALPKNGWLSRLRDFLARWLVRKVTRSTDVAKPIVLDQGNQQTRITFQLSLRAGGMAGPVMNILLEPILKPVAEDLALKIAAAIESARA